MRLIDADKLYPDCMTKNGTLAISQSQIANAPTVEPERLKGAWDFIDKLDDDNFPMDKGADIYQCSACGRRIWTFSKEPTSFYPFCHCGADMRGDKE